MRFAALLTLVACATNKDLETKVDQLSAQLQQSQNAQKELERRVDDLAIQLKESRGDAQLLAKKVDELGTKPAYKPSRPSRPEPDRAKTYAVQATGVDVDGKDEALVTMVWAYDYACPYCEKVRDTVEQLQQKYGADFRVVHKAFVVHPQVATAPALAACAAAKQKKFAALDKLLWEKGFKGRNFDKDDPAGGKCWESAAGCPVVLGYAKEAKLDTKKLKDDMKSCKQDIDDQMHELQTFGVGATPSFFINGRFMSGAMPIENFSTIIDEELAKAKDRVKAGTKPGRYYQEWVVDKGEKSLAAVATP